MLRAVGLLTVAAIACGCANNPYAPAYKVLERRDAYERYRPTPIEIAQLRASYAVQKEAWETKHPGRTFHPHSTVRNPYAEVKVTDMDVVLYADHVRNILATRFTNARMARYTGATVQVLLAGAAGVAAAFSAGTTVIAGLAFGSAVTPEVSRIAGARERAEVYQAQAVQIDLALERFAATNGEDSGAVSRAKLTPQGRRLYVEIVTALNAVDARLVEILPAELSPEQMKDLRMRMDSQVEEALEGQRELRKQFRDFEKEMRALAKASPSPSPSPAAAGATTSTDLIDTNPAPSPNPSPGL